MNGRWLVARGVVDKDDYGGSRGRRRWGDSPVDQKKSMRLRVRVRVNSLTASNDKGDNDSPTGRPAGNSRFPPPRPPETRGPQNASKLAGTGVDISSDSDHKDHHLGCSTGVGRSTPGHH